MAGKTPSPICKKCGNVKELKRNGKKRPLVYKCIPCISAHNQTPARKEANRLNNIKQKNNRKKRRNWRRKNDPIFREKEYKKNAIYTKNRIQNDIRFKLKKNLRVRLNRAIKRNSKTGSAVKDLGCSIEDFKWWLEFWFEEGMTWDNYGQGLSKWNIDHIIPLASVDLTNKEEFLKVNNYKNLQPLWEKNHKEKTKIDNIKINEKRSL